MKKALLVACGCLAAGAIGLTVTLPLAAGEVVDLYNAAVVEGQQQEYQVEELSAEVTQLRLICQRSGMQFVEVRSSQDHQARLYYRQGNALTAYGVEVTTEDSTAQIVVTKQDVQPLFNRETLVQLLYDSINAEPSLILEVPETVSLISDEGDGVYLGVNGGVKFANVDVIRDYGYLPSENESWRQKYEEAQSEMQQLTWQLEDLRNENELLHSQLEQEQGSGELVIEEGEAISPSSILRMEGEMDSLRQLFQDRKMDLEDYTRGIQALNEGSTELRVQQAIRGDRPELEDLIRQLGALIGEYNQIEAQILNAERDYTEELIDQKQYNSIVQAYEDSMRSLNEQIALAKGDLAQQGYQWNSAVLVPNS